MRILLLSICFGLLSLNAYSQSKLVGAGKATKVGGSAASKTVTTKTPAKTTTPVKKTPSQTPAVKQDPNAKYASSGYMEISGVSFANIDNDGHIIDDYGSNLYASEVKYLKPKVFYRGLASVEKEISVDVKIIKEDGTLEKGTGSPEGYTYSYKYNVEPGSGKSIELSGWGRNNGGSYTSGQYKFEVWYNGNILYQKGLRLYSGTTPLATSKIVKITNVSFANQMKDGTIINDYGSTLYEGDIQYVAPKLYYNGLYSNNQNVSLYYKIFYPTGSMMSGTSSPLCYTSKQDIVIKPGSNTLVLSGYGSTSTTVYKEGEHKVEYWLDGEKIYETKFNVKKKSISSPTNTSTSNFLKNIILYPMGDATLSSLNETSTSILKGLQRNYTVDDCSKDGESVYYVWGRTLSNKSEWNYQDMIFDNFYYYNNNKVNNTRRRFKYDWNFPTSSDCYAFLDRIVKDFSSIGINIEYERKNETYIKAYGEAVVENRKYYLEVNKYSSSYQLSLGCRY